MVGSALCLLDGLLEEEQKRGLVSRLLNSTHKLDPETSGLALDRAVR